MIDLYYWPPLTVIKSRQTAMHWARVRISMDSPRWSEIRVTGWWSELNSNSR
jgi:hypothetical protein